MDTQNTQAAQKNRLFKMFTILLIVITFTIVAGLFVHIVENFRGKTAFEKWKNTHPDFNLDFRAYIPPEVPDDQNFAICGVFKDTIPLFSQTPKSEQVKTNDLLIYNLQSMIHLLSDNNTSESLIDISETAKNIRQNTNNFPDLPAKATDAEVLFYASKKSNQIFDELRDCIETKPRARFPIDYTDVSPRLPHLTKINQLTRILQLRVVAFLETGKTDEAFQNARLAFILANSIKDENFMISQLVRFNILNRCCNIIHEGIRRSAWNQTHLSQFQSILYPLNTLQDFVKTIPADTAWLIHAVEKARITKPDFLDELLSMSKTQPNEYTCCPPTEKTNPIAIKLIPHGWFYQNYVNLSHYMHSISTEGFDTQNNRVFPKKIEALTGTIWAQKNTPYTLLVKVVAQKDTFSKAAFTQTTINCYKLACAIEKYRLQNKSIPEKLDTLTPQYIQTIPSDIIDGKPLRYNQEKNNRYTIYSIGWDEKDNGGANCKKTTEKDKDWAVTIRWL
ncbi:MAG: hypothetical protein N2487_00045 [Verrucomicrobiae bacterium]|nr:hypothetical protein [Verrucomicrobiae bacterium]